MFVKSIFYSDFYFNPLYFLRTWLKDVDLVGLGHKSAVEVPYFVVNGMSANTQTHTRTHTVRNGCPGAG